MDELVVFFLDALRNFNHAPSVKYSHSKKRYYNGVKSAPTALRNLLAQGTLRSKARFTCFFSGSYLSPLRLDSAHCCDKFSAHSNRRFFSLEHLLFITF